MVQSSRAGEERQVMYRLVNIWIGEWCQRIGQARWRARWQWLTVAAV